MSDLLRQEIATAATTIVVKVGTRCLTRPDGQLNEDRIGQLAEELHQVMSTGRKVALVSSGAVGAGMGRLGLAKRPADLPHLQAVAAVGQSILVEAYERSLRQFGRHAAQVLLTRRDMEHRTSYLNARNTLLTLLDLGAVPIINENDTISVEELDTTFGDNDRLAAIVANLIQAPLLALLSDVEGLYDGDPSAPGAKLVPTVKRLDRSVFDLVRDKLTGLSKGGMASKLEAARQATSAGASVVITSGRQSGVVMRILSGEPVGTLFLAKGQLITARKRWIGLTVKPRGQLVLDEGACQAVEKDGRSLLPAGIVEVVGNFQKGDIVALRDGQGVEIARGLANYCADDVRRIKGLRTRQIVQVLGSLPYEEVIHRNNMLVTSLD